MKLPKYIIEKLRKGRKYGNRSRKLLNEIYGFFEDKGIDPEQTDVGYHSANLGELICDFIDSGDVSMEEFLGVVHEIVVAESIKENEDVT